jgi:hypothetical protein
MAVAGDAQPQPLCLTLDDVVALQQQFGSNIRRIEHYLYEVFQRLAEKEISRHAVASGFLSAIISPPTPDNLDAPSP